MAQTRERSNTGSVAAPTTPTTGERKSFFSRLVPSRTAGTAQPARPQSGMGKLLVGWVVLLLALEIVTVGLQYADIQWFNLALERPWFPKDHNVLLVGGLNWFIVINLVVIVGAYYLLVRLKVLPRDLFNSRARMATQNQAQVQRQPGKSAPDGMGKTAARTRAARRHAASTTAAAAPPPSARRVAAKARIVTPPPPPPAPIGHDTEYERVKAAQRQRRRRDAKR